MNESSWDFEFQLSSLVPILFFLSGKVILLVINWHQAGAVLCAWQAVLCAWQPPKNSVPYCTFKELSDILKQSTLSTSFDLQQKAKALNTHLSLIFIMC